MLRKIIDIYYTHLIRPFMEVSLAIPDEEEVCMSMTIMLFQFSEVLSNEGHVICKSYKEKLFTALYEYQLSKFPEKTDIERIQRYAQLLEMMQRVTVRT
uniref:NR LBD domain-containing protein n=1 Tax=Panagrolaimus davidi TaxID=227884 RepID=A0A914QYW7_9BILA